MARPMASKTTVGAVVAVVALIAATSMHYREYLLCSDCLDEWASLVTLFSLGIAPLWYLLRKELDRRSEIMTVSTGLYLELADTRDGLDDDRHGNLKAVELADGTKIRFMNRMFSHDIYDSLIHSGRIHAIRAEFQQQIQDVFRLIKYHNAILRSMRDIEVTAKDAGIHARYYKELDRTDSTLRMRVPALMDVLKRAYRIPDESKLRRFDPNYVRPYR